MAIEVEIDGFGDASGETAKSANCIVALENQDLTAGIRLQVRRLAGAGS